MHSCKAVIKLASRLCFYGDWNAINAKDPIQPRDCDSVQGRQAAEVSRLPRRSGTPSPCHSASPELRLCIRTELHQRCNSIYAIP